MWVGSHAATAASSMESPAGGNASYSEPSVCVFRLSSCSRPYRPSQRGVGSDVLVIYIGAARPPRLTSDQDVRYEKKFVYDE